jgi:hypothetical protein
MIEERVFDTDELGQHFIHGGNELGTGLLSPPDKNHLDEFRRQVHIGFF